MQTSIKDLVNRAKAIIFDCDGTLVNSAPIYALAWKKAFALSGKIMTEDWYRERHGLCAQQLMNAFEKTHEVSLDSDAVLILMREHYLRNIGQLNEIYPTCNIARELYGRLPLAVASGGSSVLVSRSLRALGLDTLFTEIVTQDQVKTPKPNPDIFLEAAHRLGEQPKDCLVFEDSEQGFAAAKAAKMPIIDVANVINESGIEKTMPSSIAGVRID